MRWWGITVVVVALCAVAMFVYVRIVPPVYTITYDQPPILPQEYSIVEINGHDIRTIVVDTPGAREKGLSERSSLDPDEGMLFVFENDGMYSFWMKDMRFPIDIIWISTDGYVVDVRENVSPDTYPISFSPKKPARYVLELPAHAVKRFNIHRGDIVRP
ncbi:MAG: DUF192 domain-containing protein [bacterium]|nr:DUF192 domain-containing protein [bacterium]